MIINKPKIIQLITSAIVWIIGVAAVVALLALMLTSCTTIKEVVKVENRDSIAVRTLTDSVYIYKRDSIVIQTKGDTVFVDKWHTLYKDKIKEKTDTLYINKEVVDIQYVERATNPNWWKLFLAGIGIGVVGVIVVRLVVRAYLHR